MKLKDQCCALELAKRLKELGVPQNSIFVWEYEDDHCYGIKFFPYAVVPNDFNSFKLYSAYTVAELGEMLPDFVELTKIKNIKIATIYSEDNGTENNVSVIDDTEANARAKMLIHLIENGLVKLGDLK
jgi:hypothetical protein